MQKNDYQKLLECPFCGREADVTEVYMGRKKIYRVECMEIDCPVKVSTFTFGTREEAIEMWNTRKGEQEC